MSIARRTVLAAFVMALVATGLIAPVSQAATWTAPGFVKSISGHGEAGVYAWGIQYNPVSNEILVGDYWNYQIRRYDLQGNPLGAFYRPANIRDGQPYTISVDRRNGDIYVVEIGNPSATPGSIAHYDRFGTYIDELHVGGYIAWTTIDGDGNFYVASGHLSTHSKIEKYDLDNGMALETTWGTNGTGPGQFSTELRGIDTDASGNVYVADSNNKRVEVFTADGTWLRDFGGPGTGVGQFTGDLRGLAIDRVNGWVYVVDAAAGQIEKFDLNGNPLAHWGSTGQGTGQFADGGRQITVDASGNVWVSDYGNFRFFEYNPNGTLLRTAPVPGTPPPPGFLSQNRDVAVDPVNGDIWSTDSWNNRFQKFTTNGAFLGTWGIRASEPPYGMDYPRGIAVNPVNRDVWVADTRESVIRVYDRLGNYKFSVGSGITSSDPGSFRLPMDMEFSNGLVYVSDYGQLYGGDPHASCRVKVVDATTGAELASIATCNYGVAVDPATGRVFVVSANDDEVFVYSAYPALAPLFTFGSSGTGNGQFQSPWDIDIANGTIYVTDAQLNRVQAFDLNGNFLGTWGTGGTGAFQLSGPSGITHDAAGNLYVADAGNDRIQVFSPSVPLPSGDTTKPAITIGAPAVNAVLPAVSPVNVTGTASDNLKIGRIDAAIQDRSTGLWWNASLAIWQANKQFATAAISWGAGTNVTYRFAFIGLRKGGQYSVQTRATDTSGNTLITAARNFSISP
jgi:DNA-binding beta-propeller fold protein YncE